MTPPQHLMATLRGAASMSAVVNAQVQLALKKTKKEERIVRDCLETAQVFVESITNLLVESYLSLSQDTARAMADLPAEFTTRLRAIG